MQATCVRRECPKWHIPSSNNKSILQNLATELLVEIFQHLGWEDVFVMRRTCQLFYDISISRPLWVCLFYRLSNEVRVPPILERPISAYTAEELEYVVMRRISSEVRWANGAEPRVRVLSMLDWDSKVDPDFEVHDQVLVLDGGRWLLTCRRRNRWRVYAHDLDMPLSDSEEEPRCIIDLNSEEQGWQLAYDVDRDATSELAYILCLIPWSTIRPDDSPSDWAPAQIHIYRLTVKGRGNEATLEAQKLKSLPNDLPGIIEMIDMRGHHLIRSIYEADASFYHS
ncbi:hypothetical protein BJ912DRAFT_631956 [Pholiota molesta]|nr:hypothetical protein BJ912DRAFT_631956 [Pholiota molesta]